VQPYSTAPLHSVKIGKKRKRTQSNKNDKDEKKVLTCVSSKRQKLQIVNGKNSRINMIKKKKRRTRVHVSMRHKLQLWVTGVLTPFLSLFLFLYYYYYYYYCYCYLVLYVLFSGMWQHVVRGMCCLHLKGWNEWWWFWQTNIYPAYLNLWCIFRKNWGAYNR
jgi:hypothetical protein